MVLKAGQGRGVTKGPGSLSANGGQVGVDVAGGDRYAEVLGDRAGRFVGAEESVEHHVSHDRLVVAGLPVPEHLVARVTQGWEILGGDGVVSREVPQGEGLTVGVPVLFEHRDQLLLPSLKAGPQAGVFDALLGEGVER